ncbi:deoxyguanosinetriphosphate triphosphohydrolase [Desulfobacter hydrogenophilus]|uniref:Deoxyguanosinetriphosphate triphosphohydrolase n=1 Tax=Desulfobacter hydrogenophilus TaxID=2291 RepID=A0A328FG93_9BACT|nr:deoxyguanosinetriphosphate triphosphohydrolase [Desulfobacter hydrogenophilus]NDY71966.1 deoxyguanosinetriphosphate triphosphohydrolase [Desulfobacter hydrogenophilus]QBH12342.1 deoxyguanosinetriphosphate triphosphohydrolase [Desulfobacter hydrogenophilus]RAM02057.1 deoxyguanosinetriphosphate triphosphohydrolase [Desulfobacter hydrogenophilus]
MNTLNSKIEQNPSIREIFQQREHNFLSRYGTPSTSGKRRHPDVAPDKIRTPFQLDRDRIVYSNAFRRLKYKTQVFLSPLGDHYRTRLTHTLEVSETARNIARAMRLNEDLAEAVALGHDLGHTPFGHGGETALIQVHSSRFTHSDQSLRVVDVLENRGKGLNLTTQVRDGILKHSKGFGNIIPATPGETASTIEGRIVRVADIIAYLNHDLDDALRGKVIFRDEVPDICTRKLGKTHSARASTMMEQLVYNSGPQNGEFILSMGEETMEAMTILRKFLFEKVYRSPAVHGEFVKAKKVIIGLYKYFMENPDEMQKELEKMEMAPWDSAKNKLKRSVCDVIASMTDRYALKLYARLFFPNPLV